MAKLEKESNIPELITGILMPVIQNRWRAVINSREVASTNVFSMQVIRCKVNYKTKTIDVYVEQNTNGDLCKYLFDLMSKTFQFRLDCMDGDDGIYFSTEFMHSTIVDHELNYDYSKGGTLNHRIKISFDQLQILENKS